MQADRKTSPSSSSDEPAILRYCISVVQLAVVLIMLIASLRRVADDFCDNHAWTYVRVPAVKFGPIFSFVSFPKPRGMEARRDAEEVLCSPFDMT